MYHPKDVVTAMAEYGTKIVRLLRSTVSPQASRVGAASVDEQKPKAYIVSNRRMQEIDAQKAFVRAFSNSDKWKAGGPY